MGIGYLATGYGPGLDGLNPRVGGSQGVDDCTGMAEGRPQIFESIPSIENCRIHASKCIVFYARSATLKSA